MGGEDYSIYTVTLIYLAIVLAGVIACYLTVKDSSSTPTASDPSSSGDSTKQPLS